MGKSEVTNGEWTIRALQDNVEDFNRRRGWPEVHSARSLSEAIVVESAELLQLSLWGASAESDMEAVRSEMADVGIYLLSLANHLELDLGAVIVEKLAKNERRFPDH